MRFNVFAQSPTVGGNLMAIVRKPHNPRDSGVPVTVKIEPSEVASARFRFFYPNSKEASICGHALLGAAQTLGEGAHQIETGAGIKAVYVDGVTTWVNFGRRTTILPTFTDTPPLQKMFGVDNGLRVRGIYSAGKPKLILEANTVPTLKSLVFNLEQLYAWNKGKNFTGYIIFCHDNDAYFARATNPLFNIDEDPACAVCCAALPLDGAATIRMGNPEFVNLISVEERDEDVWLGGNVFPVD